MASDKSFIYGKDSTETPSKMGRNVIVGPDGWERMLSTCNVCSHERLRYFISWIVVSCLFLFLRLLIETGKKTASTILKTN